MVPGIEDRNCSLDEGHQGPHVSGVNFRQMKVWPDYLTPDHKAPKNYKYTYLWRNYA